MKIIHNREDCTRCPFAKDIRKVRPMSPLTCTCSLTGERQVAEMPRCNLERKRQAIDAKKEKGGRHG